MKIRISKMSYQIHVSTFLLSQEPCTISQNHFQEGQNWKTRNCKKAEHLMMKPQNPERFTGFQKGSRKEISVIYLINTKTRHGPGSIGGVVNELHSEELSLSMSSSDTLCIQRIQQYQLVCEIKTLDLLSVRVLES